VRIRHAELVDEDGRLNRTTNRTAEATVAYVCAGGGWEEYRPHFTYQGFRYAEIVGFPGVPNLETLEATFIHSDVPKTGAFASSSDLLNRVHRNVIWGQLSNLMSIPTDCPQRDERMGWLGDAQLTAEEACFNFDMSLFYAKYIDDIDAAQKPDGSLSDVVPPYWSLYPADPAWGSALLILAWNVYWFYGDERVLEDHYEAMQRYVGFLASQADGHILRDFGKYGDWCPPGSILPKRTPMALVSTWYYYHDTMLLKRIAEVLRDSSEVTALEEQGRKIKAAFNREFLEDHGYAINKMSPRDSSPSQTSNLLPLALDLVPDEHRAKVVERLLYSIEHDYDDHLDTGIVGTRYLFDVLTRIGRPDLAYRVATQKSYPGWGYMLSEDATTLWERWEKLTGRGMNSHNHIMLGSVDAWYYKAVAGIEPVAAGWKKIRFAPTPVGDLTWASAWVDTVRGRAAVSWEISRDPNTEQLRLSVEVPTGANAEVVLPAGGEATLVEGSTVLFASGTSVDTVAGVSSIEHDGDAFHLHVESGAYYFVTSTARTA
jgi:alpha-L-rhamnosidase